jgi:hypothetical protein
MAQHSTGQHSTAQHSTVPLHGIILIIVTDEARYFLILHEIELGHSRKHPYHPHRRNWTLTPLPPSDVLILHLLLSETILSPLPLRTAEISSVGECGSFMEIIISFEINSLMESGTPELGAGGAAAPVALYQEGQGGRRCPFNLKDCLGEIANCQKC